MKNVRVPTWLGILIILGFTCLCLPNNRNVSAYLFGIPFGWISFLQRVVPSVQVSREGVLTAVLCLLVLVPGLQVFLRWASGATAGTGRRWKWRWTVVLLALVVLTFTAGTAAVGVTHQTGWLINSPDPLVFTISDNRNILSYSNLRQIDLALQIHNSEQHHFPAGGTFDERGRALHGWQTAILPYLEQQVLYDRIDQKRPWSDPANGQAFATVLDDYLHPSIGQKSAHGYALSHYAANGRVFTANRTVTLKELEEKGTANVIFGGEAAGNFKPWGYPANWRDPAAGLNRSPDGFGGPPGQGMTQLMMADGSVRSFRSDADPAFLILLADPSPDK